MKIYLDVLLSNLIVFSIFIITLVLWNIYFNDEDLLTYIFFPFGIIILTFLFFGNIAILGLISGYIIYHYIFLKSNTYLYLNDTIFLISSLSYIFCMPILLLILNLLNFKIGIGNSYKLDKTNIYHVILVTFFASIIYLILIFIFSLFILSIKIDIYEIIGNFIGASLLILILKLIFAIQFFVRKLF